MSDVSEPLTPCQLRHTSKRAFLQCAASVLVWSFLAVICSACSFFGRSHPFIAYQLPLSVGLRTDTSIDRAVLEYRDACGQPMALAIDRPLREALESKLGKVFHKLIITPSDTTPVDGVVDVALGMRQVELFIPRKADRSYPATITLGLDFTYSDADGTVRHSKKLQSQTREEVEVAKESCAVKGLEDLAKQTVDTVVEGMAKQLGESAKIRESAQMRKPPKSLAAIPDQRIPPPTASRSADAPTPPTQSDPAAQASDTRDVRPTKLGFRAIFRDQNRNQVLESEERFTVDFDITNEGEAPAENVEIELAGHPALLQNLVHPVSVGTVRPGEVRRLTVAGTLGSVSEVDQAELICILRAAGRADAPPAKKFVVAVRPDKAVESEVLSVDVDQMPQGPSKLKQPHSIGIAIGVGRFRDPALATVEFADRDAEIMAKYFHSFMGIPHQRIRVLQDSQAMRDDLTEVFEQWLPQHADPRGTALVYLAGRAVVEAATGAVSLIPYDGRTASPPRLFSLARLQRALARAPIGKVVLILDLSLDPSPTANSMRTPLPAWDIERDGMGTDRVIWIVGNTAMQEAHAYIQGRHGLFTYYLLKGLRGAADLDQNGLVLVGELCRYLPRQVETAAKEQFGNAQQPACLPDADRRVSIRAVPLSKMH